MYFSLMRKVVTSVGKIIQQNRNNLKYIYFSFEKVLTMIKIVAIKTIHLLNKIVLGRSATSRHFAKP